MMSVAAASAVGLFSMDNLKPHRVVTLIFFCTRPVAVALFTAIPALQHNQPIHSPGDLVGRHLRMGCRLLRMPLDGRGHCCFMENQSSRPHRASRRPLDMVAKENRPWCS